MVSHRQDVGDIRFHEGLRAILREAFRREVQIEHIDCQASDMAGRWPADVLRVTLSDGAKLSLYRKHVSVSGHPDKDVPDKEVRVYRELLSGGDLPVPRYYGTGWNESSDLHELYLEHIPDWPLKYQSLEEWPTAASALARLHSAFADRTGELRSCEYLPALDADYFWTWLERAQRELGEYLPVYRERLDGLASRYDEVVGLLANGPQTLVHNDLAPRNVLADRSSRPTRICFIDWENASVGCGFLDLAHLVYGLDDTPRRAVCEAYFDGLAGTSIAPDSAEQAHRILAACEVHRVVYRVGRSRYRDYSPETVGRLLEHGEAFYGQL